MFTFSSRPSFDQIIKVLFPTASITRFPFTRRETPSPELVQLLASLADVVHRYMQSPEVTIYSGKTVSIQKTPHRLLLTLEPSRLKVAKVEARSKTFTTPITIALSELVGAETLARACRLIHGVLESLREEGAPQSAVSCLSFLRDVTERLSQLRDMIPILAFDVPPFTMYTYLGIYAGPIRHVNIQAIQDMLSMLGEPVLTGIVVDQYTYAPEELVLEHLESNPRELEDVTTLLDKLSLIKDTLGRGLSWFEAYPTRVRFKALYPDTKTYMIVAPNEGICKISMAPRFIMRALGAEPFTRRIYLPQARMYLEIMLLAPRALGREEVETVQQRLQDIKQILAIFGREDRYQSLKEEVEKFIRRHTQG